jgi:hypothetical protein
MNTIWLKLAGGVVGVIIVLAVIGQFTGGKSPSAPAPQAQKADQPKGVYDSFARDDKKFGVKFQGEDEHEANAAPAAAAAPPQPPVAQAAPPEPPKQPHFQKLTMEQEVEAQRLHAMALEERKRARLPMMSPKMMIDYCREIIQKWPKSEYAYKAKLMLDDLPERHKETYHITPQETDVSSFYK